MGNNSEKRLHQAALAGAVGTHQGGVGFGRQAKAHLLHRRERSAAHGEPVDFENHFRHGSRLANQRHSSPTT